MWQPMELAPRDGSTLIFLHCDGHIGIGSLQDVRFGGHDLKFNTAAWAGQKDYDPRPGVWIEAGGPFSAVAWMPAPVAAERTGA
ncbi:MAG: hypothetical protein ACRCYS_05670 [Beijerinckiaceae bacterium]